VNLLKAVGVAASAGMLGGMFLIFYLTLPFDRFTVISGLVLAYFVPPFGKESIIPVLSMLGFHPLFGAVAIAYTDIAFAVLLLWNYDEVKRLPVIGKWMERTERKSSKYQERAWVRTFSLLFLVLFVIVPFQGSGAFGGTILGRLLGMDRYTVFAGVVMGAVLGCVLLGLLALPLYIH